MRILLSLLTLSLLAPVQALAAGRLTVTQESVANASVPKGAQRVPFLSLTLEAGCDAPVTVREVTVSHDGFGDANDLTGVYAMAGLRRVTRSRTIDSSDRTATLRFLRGFTIAACASETLTIGGNISSDARTAGEHRLSVAVPADIRADAAVTLSSKLSGGRTATVRPASIGTVHMEFLDLLRPLRYGSNRTLARLRLEADGEADQDIRSIVLTNDGKAADGDLKNLRIQNRKGEILTNVASSMDGDRVTLTFEPWLRLDRNDETLLELKGDIRASRRKTVRFVLEEPSDLETIPRIR